jgi:hypothetical protein
MEGDHSSPVVLKLGVSGAVPLEPLYSFRASTGTTFPVYG